MNHCSSEGTTVGIQSYLSSRLKFQFKTKFQNRNKIFNSISNQIIFQNSFSILHQIQILIKVEETIHLSNLWEHTITKIFKLDPKYKVDCLIRQWVIYNKLEDFNSLLNYTDEDSKPYGAGNLS